MLVDPSIVKTLTFPRDINELIQKLSHNYIAYFDNVSVIKDGSLMLYVDQLLEVDILKDNYILMTMT